MPPITGPDGVVMAEAACDKEEILVARVDPDAVGRERYRRHPFSGSAA